MTKNNAERERVIGIMREWLPVGTTVYGIVVHVSASGMSRSIRFMYVENGAIRELPPSWVAAAIGERFDEKRWAVQVSGCGMDMVFASIYNLAKVLHGDSQSLKQGRL